MKTREEQLFDGPTREPVATSCVLSVIIHALLILVVISGSWLWGSPVYSKPSAYVVALVDAPLSLDQPTPAMEEPQRPTTQEKIQPDAPVKSPQVSPEPMRVSKPVPKKAAVVPKKKTEAVKPAAKPVKKAQGMALPAKQDKKAPAPAKQRPAPPKRAAKPQTASSSEVQSDIARLRQRQVRQEAQRQRHEQAQRQAAEQRVAALRTRMTQDATAGATMEMATGMQRIRLQAYQDRVREKIIDAWILPLPPEEAQALQATALLLVRRTGEVEQLKLVQSSGNSLFDASLMRAIQRAVPLPVLPDDYPGELLEVEMRFSSRDS